ncbi:MAG: hypothetical protein ACLPX8_04005, partial [Bryobacteraceae bacterium]
VPRKTCVERSDRDAGGRNQAGARRPRSRGGNGSGERNAWTLPQERYNADWVREQGVGVVLKNFRGIAEAVDGMLAPAAYARYRAATGRQNNRAVFEIPEMLERIGKEAGE